MGRTAGSMNKRKYKDQIINSVLDNDYRTMNHLAYELMKKFEAEEVLIEKGYKGNILEIARRLPHKEKL